MRSFELVPVGEDLLACHDCDALHRLGALPSGATGRCTRCGADLYHARPENLATPLAWTLTGLILFIIANTHPLLQVTMAGQIQESTLMGGVSALYREGWWVLAFLVFGTSVLFPLLNLLGLFYLLVPLWFRRRPPWGIGTFRMVIALMPWSMVGIYLLGVMVAMVKLSDLSTVTPGIALFAFAALTPVTAAADSALDQRLLWKRLAAP